MRIIARKIRSCFWCALCSGGYTGNKSFYK